MNGGHIQLIIGPMFSGKSTELIRRVRRYQIAQYKCVTIKYSNDNRYGTGLWTHDKNNFEALEATKLCDVLESITDFSVIGIDEGQFFPDIVEFGAWLQVDIYILYSNTNTQDYETDTISYHVGNVLDVDSHMPGSCDIHKLITNSKPTRFL